MTEQSMVEALAGMRAEADAVCGRPDLVDDVLRIVASWLADGEECWFDHHGGCQAHDFLTLGGMACPMGTLNQFDGPVVS